MVFSKGRRSGLQCELAACDMHFCKCRIEGIVKLLRERMPATRILLMGILPRHKMNYRGRLDWPMFYTEVCCNASATPLQQAVAHCRVLQMDSVPSETHQIR